MSITTMEGLEAVPDGTVIRSTHGRWEKQGEMFTRADFTVPASYFTEIVQSGMSIVEPGSHLQVGERITNVQDLEDLPIGTVLNGPSVGYWRKTNENAWTYRNDITIYTDQTIANSYTDLVVKQFLTSSTLTEGSVLTTPAHFAGLRVGAVVRTDAGRYTKEAEDRWVKAESVFTDAEMSRFGTDVTLEVHPEHAVGDQVYGYAFANHLPNRTVVRGLADDYRFTKRGITWRRERDGRDFNTDSVVNRNGGLVIETLGEPRSDGLPDEGTEIGVEDERFARLPQGTFLYDTYYGDNVVILGGRRYNNQGTEIERGNRFRILAYAETTVVEPEVPQQRGVADALNSFIASHDLARSTQRDLVQVMEDLGLEHERTLRQIGATVAVSGTTDLSAADLSGVVGDVAVEGQRVRWHKTLRFPRVAESDQCVCGTVTRDQIEGALRMEGVSFTTANYDIDCGSEVCDNH